MVSLEVKLNKIEHMKFFWNCIEVVIHNSIIRKVCYPQKCWKLGKVSKT